MEDASGLQRRQHCQGKPAVLVSLLGMICKKVFQSFTLSIHNLSPAHVLLKNTAENSTREYKTADGVLWTGHRAGKS